MKKNLGMFLLVALVALALLGCQSKMLDASKLEKSVNIVVTDYLPKLAASEEPDSIKKTNTNVALGLKELVDRALYGPDEAIAKRKALEGQ